MQKKKVLILLGGLLVLVASFSLFAWVGAASKPVTFDVSTPIALNMKGNYNAQKIPPGFDKKKNVETGKGIGSRKILGQLQNFTSLWRMEIILTLHLKLGYSTDYIQLTPYILVNCGQIMRV